MKNYLLKRSDPFAKGSKTTVSDTVESVKLSYLLRTDTVDKVISRWFLSRSEKKAVLEELKNLLFNTDGMTYRIDKRCGAGYISDKKKCHRPIVAIAPRSKSVKGGVRPGGVGEVDPSTIKADPSRFQYKRLSNSEGEVGSLSGVKKYDPNLAGIVQVWKDPNDGNTYVVNGHNRLALAKRADAPLVAVRMLDVPTAKAARAVGALTNIAEGRGDELDSAKFFKDSGLTREDLDKKGIPLRERIATRGLAISQLEDSLYRKTLRGDLSIERAAIIGKAKLEPEQQLSLVKLIEKRSQRGEITNSVLRELVDTTKSAATWVQTSLSLFGEEEIRQSLALEKAQLQAGIKQRLSREKKLFGTVSKSSKALEKGGNRINQKQSGEISSRASTALNRFDQQKNLTGPVSSMINEAATRLANGEPKAKVERELYNQILQNLNTDGESAIVLPSLLRTDRKCNTRYGWYVSTPPGCSRKGLSIKNTANKPDKTSKKKKSKSTSKKPPVVGIKNSSFSSIENLPNQKTKAKKIEKQISKIRKAAKKAASEKPDLKDNASIWADISADMSFDKSRIRLIRGHEGEIVAAASLKKVGDKYKLEYLAANIQNRVKGSGSNLMAQILKETGGNLELEALPKAVGFYKKLGFTDHDSDKPEGIGTHRMSIRASKSIKFIESQGYRLDAEFDIDELYRLEDYCLGAFCQGKRQTNIDEDQGGNPMQSSLIRRTGVSSKRTDLMAFLLVTDARKAASPGQMNIFDSGGEGKPCGESHISKSYSCHIGKGSAAKSASSPKELADQINSESLDQKNKTAFAIADTINPAEALRDTKLEEFFSDENSEGKEAPFEPTPDLIKVRDALARADVPSYAYEYIAPSEWTKGELNQKSKEADKYIVKADQFGVEDLQDLDPDDYRSKLLDKDAKLPPIPKAEELRSLLLASPSPAKVKETLEDGIFEGFTKTDFKKGAAEIRAEHGDDDPDAKAHDYVANNPDLIKAGKRFYSFDPESIGIAGEFESKSDAQHRKQTIELSLHPNLRKFGKGVPESRSGEDDRVFEWLYDELSAIEKNLNFGRQDGLLEHLFVTDARGKARNSSGKIPGKKCGGSYISARYNCKSHKNGNGKLTQEGKESARELAAKVRSKRGLQPKQDKPKKRLPKLKGTVAQVKAAGPIRRKFMSMESSNADFPRQTELSPLPDILRLEKKSPNSSSTVNKRRVYDRVLEVRDAGWWIKSEDSLKSQYFGVRLNNLAKDLGVELEGRPKTWAGRTAPVTQRQAPTTFKGFSIDSLIRRSAS